MDERDPKRWATADADVPERLRQILGSAAVDDPDAARLDRFVGRAKASLPPPSAAGSAARLASAKTVAAVAVVAGGALLAWLAFGPQASTTSSSAPRHRESASSGADVAPPPSVPAAPAAQAPSPSEPAVTSAVPPAAVPAPRQPGPAVLEPAVGPARALAAPPSTARAAEPSDTLEQEVRLLRSARDLLGRDPAGALRLADEHRSRFPRGALTQEREVLSIEALARQGRDGEAQARADRFRSAFPGSAHLDRLPTRVDPGHN